MTIRVLIVDDSPTMRALLGELLGRERDIEVVGRAADANEARVMIRDYDPDVVTLDLEMPGMHGLAFLDRLMRLRPTPVVVVSGFTKEGADATAHALEIGAVDCYAKPAGRAGSMLNDGGELADLVRAAAQVQRGSSARAEMRWQQPLQSNTGAALLAIGASTGGVEALQVLLGAFPADCPPTLIVQHINGAFAGAVARRLDAGCAAKVLLAESDTPLRRGHVYLAPGNDRHLAVRAGSQLVAKLRTAEKVSGHRPSIDALFCSVAETVGERAIGMLLTGMGRDGASGLLAMRRAGARTIVQDRETSTVFGMPRAAIDIGAADVVAPIGAIAGLALAGAA